jgi:hypothetical protein
MKRALIVGGATSIGRAAATAPAAGQSSGSPTSGGKGTGVKGREA